MTQALECLKIFHFTGLLLSKVCILWAEKVQRNNLLWNWKEIKNLERNRHVVSKLAEGIWQNLTRALESLKNFHFNRLLLSKVYIVWAKKEQMNNISWNWREIQNWEGMDLSFQNWGIWWILTQALESLNNYHFNVLLLSKVYIVWAKKVQRSYLSWNWRGTHHLGRNQLVLSKLA